MAFFFFFFKSGLCWSIHLVLTRYYAYVFPLGEEKVHNNEMSDSPYDLQVVWTISQNWDKAL